jgi:alpha-mannosidase
MQGRTTFNYTLIFHEGDWRKGHAELSANRYLNPPIAEVHGTPGPWWDEVMHASVKLMERTGDGDLVYTDTHRSGWRTVFAHRDGWRRRELNRLPQLSTPPEIHPVTVEKGNIAVSAFKLAEHALDRGKDHSRDIILRLYNFAEAPELVRLNLGFPAVKIWQTDLSENPQTELTATEGLVEIEMNPWEIATLRIRTK